MRGGKLGLLGLVCALFLSLMPVAGAQVAGDPGESLEQQAFTDTANSVFRGAIDQLAALGITRGCNPPANTRYCPDDPVTRGQMAIFIVRAYNLGPASGDFFFDDNGKVYEDAANRLRQAGLTQGCGPGQYCGDETISRGEMAAFLSRAENLPDSNTDHFVDDNTSIFERGINKVADAGITLGCNPPANTNFCPNDNVTRGQMAAFIIRALTGGVTPPNPPGPPPPPPVPPKAFCETTTGINKADCQALLALYNATGGANWTNKGGWGVTKTPCTTWPGVTCLNQRVTRLILSPDETPFVGGPTPSNPDGQPLAGVLPPQIGNLTQLNTMDLAANELSGSIPTALGKLVNLAALDLSGNGLTGGIPAELGNLTNLTVELDLHANENLGGGIPASFANLTSLLILDLGDTGTSGSLTMLAGMTNLNQLDLTENSFGGAVPGSLGSLGNLEWILLSGNAFTSIGAGLVNSNSLTIVDLSSNNLNGPIPNFGNITTLEDLDLSLNVLDGEIPDNLAQLPELTTLDLANNDLVDLSVPNFLAQGTLTELLLRGNGCMDTTPENLPLEQYIAALDPLWNNGCPAPPAPPAEPPAEG
jgi:Leucine-rich repeat (LRR) protein